MIRRRTFQALSCACLRAARLFRWMGGGKGVSPLGPKGRDERDEETKRLAREKESYQYYAHDMRELREVGFRILRKRVRELTGKESLTEEEKKELLTCFKAMGDVVVLAGGEKG